MTTTSLPARAAGRRSDRRWILHIVLILGAIVMIYPMIWMVGGSLKPDDEIFSTLNPFPTVAKFANYPDGWNASHPVFGFYFLNSFIICLGAVVGNVFGCSVTAFAFARLNFRAKKFWFAMMLGSIMLPANALLVPQYLLFYKLGWVDTFLPLIVPKFLATDAFFVFLLVQFIRTIPRSLDEAATIDGCGPFRIFGRIILPLLGPALVTTVIFTFIWTYDDFFAQLIYLSTAARETVPIGLRQYIDSSGGSSYGQMLAMSALSLVPTFLVFLFSQRRIVEGISTTGIRG